MNATLTFYKFLLWVTRYELSIALSTGRDPDHIKAIRGDIAEFEGICDRLEVANVCR